LIDVGLITFPSLLLKLHTFFFKLLKCGRDETTSSEKPSVAEHKTSVVDRVVSLALALRLSSRQLEDLLLHDQDDGYDCQ